MMNNKQDDGNVKLSVIPLNVHGVRTYFKRQKMFSWLTKKNADIILLQETYSTNEIGRK